MTFGNICLSNTWDNGCCYLKEINAIVPGANGNQGAPSDRLQGILVFCSSWGFILRLMLLRTLPLPESFNVGLAWDDLP